MGAETGSSPTSCRSLSSSVSTIVARASRTRWSSAATSWSSVSRRRVNRSSSDSTGASSGSGDRGVAGCSGSASTLTPYSRAKPARPSAQPWPTARTRQPPPRR